MPIAVRIAWSYSVVWAVLCPKLEDDHVHCGDDSGKIRCSMKEETDCIFEGLQQESGRMRGGWEEETNSCQCLCSVSTTLMFKP